jgi:ATP-dependent Clp protease protease subunit
MLVPRVITRTARGERGMDIFSSLLADHIICIAGPIDDDLACIVIAQILFLEGEDPDRDISLYINSPGGSVTSVLAIYDTMEYVRPDISTVCIGQAARMSAMLVAAGAKGKRFALPNARMLIAQPSLGQISGQATDIQLHAREILRLRSVISQILAKHTGRGADQIEQDIERDLILNASQALEYGLVDVVQQSRTPIKLSALPVSVAAASELMQPEPQLAEL